MLVHRLIIEILTKSSGLNDNLVFFFPFLQHLHGTQTFHPAVEQRRTSGRKEGAAGKDFTGTLNFSVVYSKTVCKSTKREKAASKVWSEDIAASRDRAERIFSQPAPSFQAAQQAHI